MSLSGLFIHLTPFSFQKLGKKQGFYQIFKNCSKHFDKIMKTVRVKRKIIYWHKMDKTTGFQISEKSQKQE